MRNPRVAPFGQEAGKEGSPDRINSPVIITKKINRIVMVMRPEEAEVPLVREAMSKDLNYSDPDTSVCDIARTLRSDDRGSVIIKEGDEIKGMVTNSDVVNDFVVAGKGDKARDIMTKEIITISPGMGVSQGSKKFSPVEPSRP